MPGVDVEVLGVIYSKSKQKIGSSYPSLPQKRLSVSDKEICNYLLSLSFKQHPLKFPQPKLKVTPFCRSKEKFSLPNLH